MVKDEDIYIEEWLNYHRKIGFQHFYIYDNNSSNPIQTIINNTNDITFIEWKDSETDRHKRAFRHCLKNYKNAAHWIACIDIDEFIVLKEANNINIFLNDYDEHGGLSINQLIFGSSGHIETPTGNVLDNYTHRAHHSFNPHEVVKTIVNTKYVNEDVFTRELGLHNFAYNDNYSVNGNFEKIIGYRHTPHYTKIQLNHYFIKSEEEMLKKIKKGGGNGIKRSIEEFKIYDASCNEIYEVFT